MASAVDTQGLPGDPAGQIRDEKQHPVGDILRRPESLERQPRDQALLTVGAHRLPLIAALPRIGLWRFAARAGPDLVEPRQGCIRQLDLDRP